MPTTPAQEATARAVPRGVITTDGKGKDRKLPVLNDFLRQWYGFTPFLEP